MSRYMPLLAFSIVFLSSCIGDDIIDDRVDPELRINNLIDTLAVGTEYQFDATYFNNVGSEETIDIIWSSSDDEVVNILPSGLATALTPGDVEVSAFTQSSEGELSITFPLVAGDVTTEIEQSSLRKGSIRTTTFYDLGGDFEISAINESDILLSISDNYVASSALPGLYLYLTNNPRSIANAFEVGKVTVFEGAHEYEIEGVSLQDYNYLLYYCKPFDVKVGDGKIEN